MTKRLMALAAALAVGTSPISHAAQQTGAPAIRDVRAVTFPAYASYPNIAFYVPTPADYERAVSDRAFVMERLTYQSDGLDVYAYLYRPAMPLPGQRLPVVVFNRGSYTRDDFSPEVLIPANRLAHAGYVVVAPMLRGSGGAQGHDEMGGADVNDVFNILPVINAIPYADSTRIFMYGESRGGIMSLLAAKRAFPARAMAVWGAITDIGAYLAVDRGAKQLAPVIWPGFPANEAEIVESRSAIRWPEKINVPLLLMNGGADGQVSPQHALRLATALQDLKKPYELKIFHGGNHSLVARAQERDEDAIRWFRRFDVPAAKP